MARSITLVWLAALAMSSGLVARADNSAVKRELAARYDEFTAAFKQKNVDKMMAITAPGFTMKMPRNQTADAARARVLLQQAITLVQSISKVNTRIDKLSVQGGQAIATVTQTMAAKMTGQDQKPHAVTTTSVSRDTWVKSKKGWLMKSTESISEKSTVDGKFVGPQGTP